MLPVFSGTFLSLSFSLCDSDFFELSSFLVFSAFFKRQSVSRCPFLLQCLHWNLCFASWAVMLYLPTSFSMYFSVAVFTWALAVFSSIVFKLIIPFFLLPFILLLPINFPLASVRNTSYVPSPLCIPTDPSAKVSSWALPVFTVVVFTLGCSLFVSFLWVSMILLTDSNVNNSSITASRSVGKSSFPALASISVTRNLTAMLG